MSDMDGTVHKLPEDLKTAPGTSKADTNWATLTPLARNEFICWVTSAKKEETRIKRMNWACESLLDGKRRPCCWPGCPHR